jgi:hypothetical protein
MKGFVESINYEELKTLDVIEALRPLLETGWYIDIDGKVKMGRPGIEIKTPWIYTHPDINKQCHIARAINETCRMVPRVCMDCWKVVVKMQTVEQLLKLLDWQLEFVKGHKDDRFCKCGMEERPYVTYPYGGYFYNKSKTEGLKRYKEVRKAVDDIDPTIEVILKRYCTEFELTLGSSKKYERPPLGDVMEDKIYAVLEVPKNNSKQPLFLKKHIIKKWIEYAHGRGDMSYLRFNNGKELFPKMDTYHEGAR